MKPHVLIIDDSLASRLQLKESFEASGFVVTIGENLQTARVLLNKAVYSLIILDLGLPDGRGGDLVKEIRANPVFLGIPILILSGTEELNDRVEVLKLGANDFIPKPFVVDTVLAHAMSLIGGNGNETAQAGNKILLVDDSHTLLELFEMRLKENGYQVVKADSGEKALEMLARGPVDCILLDLNMPGLGGEETCRQIKRSDAWRNIPLLFLTSEEKTQSMLTGFGAGADDYVVKSSDFQIVRARVEAQMRRKRIEDENRLYRERLLQQELANAKASTAAEVAQTRGLLLAELERKNAELEAAKEKAQRESQFKTRFLASMSHELRTPLNAIIGFSELLEQELYGALNVKQKGYVGNVLRSGRHLLGLINDILDLSKIEAGKLSLSQEWASMGMIVDAVQSVVQALADKQKVSFQVDVQRSLPDMYVDPIRIKQILYNLLSNAIKYTQPGGKASLTAKQSGNHLVVVVEDTGIGIAKENLNRLFKEFERIEHAAEDKVNPEGTGLGLAITKKLVELHGGTITVESEFRKGTRVTVALPMLRGEMAGGPRLLSDSGPASSSVLIVEDDASSAELIAGHVRAVGLSALFAKNADEALKAAQEHGPAAILLDILMPGIDGWGILSKLKSTAMTAKIPVLVMSVVEEPDKGLLLGAADYLIKPIPAPTLWHSLERAGVKLCHVSGEKVALAGPEGPGTEQLRSQLQRSGCKVIRVDGKPLPPGAAEAVVADIQTEKGSEALRSCLESGPAKLPVLAMTDNPLTDDARQSPIARISVEDAQHLDRFVRALHGVLAGRGGESLLDPLTGLPGHAALLTHLRTALQRAETELKRVLMVAARVNMPKSATIGSWAEMLGSKMRRSDYFAVVDDVLILVVYGAAAHDSSAIAERFAVVLKQALHLSPMEVRIVGYPNDAKKPEELIERCCGRKK